VTAFTKIVPVLKKLEIVTSFNKDGSECCVVVRSGSVDLHRLYGTDQGRTHAEAVDWVHDHYQVLTSYSID
jgi:hypothetical protein